ncbi:MAG: hypothetical protein N3B21_06765 [Clostridia bacterium]|nr:hypothetical protein [Clostridia bacterium]
MEYTAFFVSIAVVWVLFFISIYLRPLRLSNIIIGVTTVGYSLIFDIILGDTLKLYYYINPQVSTIYIVLSAVILYPLTNIVYTLFLPTGRRAVLAYTALWIAGMLIFEYITLLTRTIVFTGWRPVPWSFVTYVITYIWIYFFYRYLEGKVTKVVGSRE